MSSNLKVHFSSRKDDWETPPNLYSVIESEFRPQLDVCAWDWNAKCGVWLTPFDDALSLNWQHVFFAMGLGGDKMVAWMNPPYGRDIAAWVRTAHIMAGYGVTTVALLPARPDTVWWWNNCRHAEVRFLPGRLRFVGAQDCAPFPSVVAIWGPEIRPSTRYWDWRHTYVENQKMVVHRPNEAESGVVEVHALAGRDDAYSVREV